MAALLGCHVGTAPRGGGLFRSERIDLGASTIPQGAWIYGFAEQDDGFYVSDGLSRTAHDLARTGRERVTFGDPEGHPCFLRVPTTIVRVGDEVYGVGRGSFAVSMLQTYPQ